MPANSIASQLLAIRKDCSESVTREELNHVKFGGALRALRMDKDISLRSMAKLLGISAPYLSDMELGHRRFQISHQMEYMKIVTKKP